MLGVLAVLAVADFAWRSSNGLPGAADGDTADVNAGDVDEAIAAREKQGTRLAIDAAVERARLAVDTGSTLQRRTQLAELLAERALLQGDLDSGGVNEATALLPTVAPRGQAALLLAMGKLDEARSRLPEDGDRRTQALLAEIVAARQPALALRLLEKDVPGLGTRPLRAKARALLANGDVDGALAALDQRLADVADDATARALRARARLENAEDAAARADVDAALAKSPFANEALALKLRLIARSGPAKDLDALLVTWRSVEQRRPEAVAARLDALRLARRTAALQKSIVDASAVVDVDVVVARARAAAFVGDVDGARAAIASVDASTLPPALQSATLALALSLSPDAKTAASWAKARPASSTAALARALGEGKDVAAVLPLLVARAPPPLDDDEALVIASLKPADPLAAALVARIATGKTAGLAAWAQKKPQDPRSLLALAHVALEADDSKTARLRLQRVEAMKDLGDDVVRALQLLFARLEAKDQHREAATARLSGQPSDVAALLASSSVAAKLSDAASAKMKLKLVRALDPLDRDVVKQLRALP